MSRIALISFLLFLGSCASSYYSAMEQFGIHKRDILIDRIEDAQESQEQGQEQFKDALEQFRSVVNFDGGELEDVYNKMNDEYEDSVSAADNIRDRIEAVESVAEALFEEWESELDEYTSSNLRRDSKRQLKNTQKKYQRLINSMHRAEQTIDPVLRSMKDNVLYLKHNLNARAIASLKGEFGSVDSDITRLINAMQKAINESNTFIEEIKQG